MRTKKPSTLQQKLGFLDDDLKKPKHDEIMLWLDKNIEPILQKLFYQPTITNEEHERLIRITNERIGLATKHLNDTFNSSADKEKTASKLKYLELWDGFESIPERPKIRVHSKVWELPITTQPNSYNSNSKYTVGFVDLGVQFVESFPVVKGFDARTEYGISTATLQDKISIDFDAHGKWLYIEVKTEINSLGELIRQIQHYKEYLRGSYYVVCPDDTYTDILKEQQIGFIKYTGKTVDI